MPLITTIFGQVNESIPSTCEFKDTWVNVEYKEYLVLFCPIESKDGRKYAYIKPSCKYSKRCDTCSKTESIGYCNYEYEFLFGLRNHCEGLTEDYVAKVIYR